MKSYYQPYALPKLPRKYCPFQNLANKSKICGRLVTRKSTGWCDEHEYCHNLLELASSIGCPEFAVNTTLFVLRGLASWEAYACIHPLRGHKEIMSRLLKMRQEYDAQNQRMIDEAMEEVRRARIEQSLNGVWDFIPKQETV